MTSEPAEMPARDALQLYRRIESAGITLWIDGGWAVDALLGEQTRHHSDLDIAIETRHVESLRRVLATSGFKEISRSDSSAWNFVLADGAGLEVDVHAFSFNGRGDGIYGPPENGDFYPASGLSGRGVIAGQVVHCITATCLVDFHRGYKLRAVDYHDVGLLCERFGIPMPVEYRDVALPSQQG